jgi:hypothetical protein
MRRNCETTQPAASPRTSAAGALVALLLAASPPAVASPLPAVGGPLLDEIAAMPAGSWKRVGVNSYGDAWAPASLRPLNGVSNPTPAKIIGAWSGFAWDSRRGDLILYGGGHANYSGNDVYRWRAASLAWERAALPSEIVEVHATNAYMAIDGADAAPASAHTYDNNVYLPLLDRFLTFGGALYNTGGNYLRPDEALPGQARRTGPYLFDPARADPMKVGGSTGSHVKRVEPFPWITGGNMWHNRDHARTLAGVAQPSKHVSGCTAYAEEDGVDVVYVGATRGSGSNPDLYRYSFPDLANPALDRVAHVGVFWNGTGGQTTCGLDPVRRLFVRTGTNNSPFVYWDLTAPGIKNRDARVASNASIGAFSSWLVGSGRYADDCGLDFDPVDRSFALWCGGPEVWRLRPPAQNVPEGWVVTQAAVSGPAAPGTAVGTGVLGKWKYVPGFDVFVALHDSTAGNVWVYKPQGWEPPVLGDAVNWMPTVGLAPPAGGPVFEPGQPVALAASASDLDGLIVRVDFLVNGTAIGSTADPPYALEWTSASPGHYVLRARAVDHRGAEGLSAPVPVEIRTGNLPPSATLTSPVAGTTFALGNAITLAASASDPDGSVARVEFYANGARVGEDIGAPYTLAWTPATVGGHTLVARAIDDRGLATDSAPVSIVVSEAPPPGTTVVLQQDANGYAGMGDTMLSYYHPATNFGGRATLQSKSQRYTDLFRFAVFAAEGGPVPDGAVIHSATLSIYKNSYNQVFRLHALLKGWTEAEATWQQARAGTAWSVPGAGGVDSDYEAQHDARFEAPFAAGWMSFEVGERLRAYAGGTPNLGWRLVAESGSGNEITLLASEYLVDPTRRPRLSITYSAP